MILLPSPRILHYLLFPLRQKTAETSSASAPLLLLVMKMARLIREKGFLLPKMFFSRENHEYLMKHASVSCCDARAEPPAGAALLKCSFD